jgi:hypothetical protein
MDFMARELRTVFGTPVISTAVSANDTISFDRVEDTGYSSGANTTTTLTGQSINSLTSEGGGATLPGMNPTPHHWTAARR